MSLSDVREDNYIDTATSHELPAKHPRDMLSLTDVTRKQLRTREFDESIVDRLSVTVGPVLARIYAARGVEKPEDLENRLDRLLSPAAMTGIEVAAELLADAIMAQANIVIVGDYDADGATSTAVALLGLTAMGAAKVSYLVPNRFENGYGLSEEIVEIAVRDHDPDLIITVDNGIASVDGVAAANRMGISVLITDHHLPGEVLPQADAIVNPNLPDCGFASKNLSGVGVMFYVLAALRQQLAAANWFTESAIPPPNLADYLDLVALGTVADLVPLDGNNRVLVAQGIKRIRAGKCRSGIVALLACAGREPGLATSRDLGFYVAPRLNAAGRLQDMSIGIACLLSESVDDADVLAQELDQINRQRQQIEAEMQSQALTEIQTFLHDTKSLPQGICIANDNWHHGVVGLIASRLKERTDRPVIAFAPDDDGALRGSARSIRGFHIRDALERIATSNPGMITKFGGHAMAAGLSLPPAHFEPFRDAFEVVVGEHHEALGMAGIIYTDGELEGEQLSLPFCESLRESGPWGQGFEEPLFQGAFSVAKASVVGEKHYRFELRGPRLGRTLAAIAFNAADLYAMPRVGEEVRIAYRLEVNDYRGQRSLQLVIVHLQRSDP